MADLILNTDKINIYELKKEDYIYHEGDSLTDCIEIDKDKNYLLVLIEK